MHKALVLLVAALVIAQAVLAQHDLTNGIYKIWQGNHNVPKTQVFFTAKPDARDGTVVVEPKNNKKDQLWKVKVYGNQITVESQAAKGKYLSTGREGNNNGAFVRLGKAQRFDTTRKHGGPWTAYELAHPRPTSEGKITVVSESSSKDENGHYYIAYINQDTEGERQAWKFSKQA
ncbi:hypothetical protein BGW42_004040 [Actinomortierella wolfii]|nr:hypothetical protein BGW42_004040 [Actinomortierella wolfii]